MVKGTHAGYPMLSLAIQPGAGPTHLYVATICQGGIYKRDPADESWALQRSGPPGSVSHDHIFHYAMDLALIIHANL